MPDLSPDDLALLTEEEQITANYVFKKHEPASKYNLVRTLYVRQLVRSLLTARRAVKKYGKHLPECHLVAYHPVTVELCQETRHHACTCGLDAALRPEGKRDA